VPSVDSIPRPNAVPRRPATVGLGRAARLFKPCRSENLIEPATSSSEDDPRSLRFSNGFCSRRPPVTTANAVSRNSSAAAFAGQKPLNRACLRPQNCGAVSRRFRATRSSANDRQIITILQQVLSSEGLGQRSTRSALLTANWRGWDSLGALDLPDERILLMPWGA
jgi:hypothetical protein